MQWNKTRQVRKQRRRMFNAPTHRLHKALTVRLDDRLIEKYKFAISRIPIRKGDKVRVVRGSYRDPAKEIEVAEVRPKDNTIVLENVTLSKADQKRVPRVFRPAHLIITKLNLSDRKRRDRIEALGILLEDEIAAEEEAAKAAEEGEEEGDEDMEKKKKRKRPEPGDEEAGEEEATAPEEGKAEEGAKEAEGPADEGEAPKKVVKKVSKKPVKKEGDQ